MTIALVHTDTESEYSTGATSLSITIDNSVSAGDMIVIPYICRSTPIPPTGFTNYAEFEVGDGIGGRAGFHCKISDGTEGGTSVTVGQAVSNRFEAFHAIFSSDAELSVSKNTTLDGDSGTSGTFPTLTETTGFLALSAAYTSFSGSDGNPNFNIGGDSDAEWTRLNTLRGVASNATGRLSGFYAIYSGADTTTLELDFVYTGTKDWGATMMTLVEGSSSTPVAFSGTVPTLNGNKDSAFSEDLSGYFNGTETPFTYSLQSGTLPAGLSLNTSTGVISGTPTASGTATGLVVRATDDGSNTADTNSFNIDIAAAVTVVKGVRVTLYDGATAQASITGITAMWWDSSPPTGSPVFTTASASTDGSGVLELDLDADTSLAVAANGHLKVYKLDGADEKDSIAWQGRLAIQDIS